jgi:hypothetical protein
MVPHSLPVITLHMGVVPLFSGLGVVITHALFTLLSLIFWGIPGKIDAGLKFLDEVAIIEKWDTILGKEIL